MVIFSVTHMRWETTLEMDLLKRIVTFIHWCCASGYSHTMFASGLVEQILDKSVAHPIVFETFQESLGMMCGTLLKTPLVKHTLKKLKSFQKLKNQLDLNGRVEDIYCPYNANKSNHLQKPTCEMCGKIELKSKNFKQCTRCKLVLY